jgi:hypothetical protein
VWTWGWEPGSPSPLPVGESTVAVDLVPTDSGTLVRLTHELPRDAAGRHAEGWEHYLSRLAVAAAGSDPGADPWLSR